MVSQADSYWIFCVLLALGSAHNMGPRAAAIQVVGRIESGKDCEKIRYNCPHQ